MRFSTQLLSMGSVGTLAPVVFGAHGTDATEVADREANDAHERGSAVAGDLEQSRKAIG